MPSGFTSAEDMPMADTAAAAPSEETGRSHLRATFVKPLPGDAGPAEQAIVAISEVDEPLPTESNLREQIYAETASHFHRALSVDAHVDRPVLRGDHAEVTAQVERREGSQIVRLGFYPAGSRHFVIWASFPASQSASLTPELDAMFETYQPPGPAPAPGKSPWLGIASMGLVGLALIAAVRFWRHRRRARDGATGTGPVDPR